MLNYDTIFLLVFLSIFALGGFGANFFARTSSKKKLAPLEAPKELSVEYTGPFKLISDQVSNDILEYLEGFEKNDKFEIKSTLIVRDCATKSALSEYGWKVYDTPYKSYEGDIPTTVKSTGLKKYNITPVIWAFIRPDMKKYIEKLSNFTFTIKFSMIPMTDTKKDPPKEAALLAAELEANEALRKDLLDFGIIITLKSEEKNS